MSFFIVKTDTKTFFDALPAIKITNFNGELKRDEIYCYGKMYMLADSLQISFTVFDGTPPATQRVGFAYNFTPNLTDDYLFFSACPTGEVCCTLQKQNSQFEVLENIMAYTKTGVDEQGWYYSMEFEIPKSLILKIFGESALKNTIFSGNMFLYDVTEDAFGSVFGVDIGEKIPTNNGFGEFVTVPY